MADELEALARDEVSAAEARTLIWSTLLREGSQARAAYSALCRWTWRVTVERRLDSELRAWHRLLLDVAGLLTSRSEHEGPGEPFAGLGLLAAAERIRGLADILRLSIDAAELVDMEEFMSRAHVKSVLDVLAQDPDADLPREEVRKQTGLGQANLSRLLTLLTVKGLLERKSISKSAAFRITAQGLRLCGETKRRSVTVVLRQRGKQLTRDVVLGDQSPHHPFNLVPFATTHQEGWRLQSGATVPVVEEPLPGTVIVVTGRAEPDLGSRIVFKGPSTSTGARAAQERRPFP